MLQTTVGQVLVNESLPKEMRDYTRKLDSKGVKNLLQTVAEKYPEQYRDISHSLSTIGHRAAYQTGGLSFGLEDMEVPPEVEAIREQLRNKAQQILGNTKLTDEEKNKLLVKTISAKTKDFETTLYERMLKDKNPLAMQVLSGARGNPSNLRSIIGGDLLYEDHHGRPIPVPVLRGYAQGFTPAEYWASSFGTRKGVADLKFATQEAGFFGKQLNQIAHRLVITAKDHPKDLPEHQFKGLPVDTDDPDSEGALLAQDIGPYKRNTVLTPRLLSELKARGKDRILIRSPLVGGPPQGGLYARDVGMRDRAGLSPIGDYVGMAAAQALCLDGETHVRMADGSVKLIKDIVAGDTILGCSCEGLVKPVRVLAQTFSGIKPCVRAVFRRGTGDSVDDNLLELIATKDHKILSELLPAHRTKDTPDTLAVRKLGTEFKRSACFCAAEYTGGDRLRRCNLVSREEVGDRPTYDLYVDHPDHLFVLETGLIVSNSEPVTQAQISSKHTGGVAGAGTSVAGFKYINQFVQVPKTFQEGASHASTDGKVGAIWNAPAGGKYLMINGTRHYVHPNHNVKVKVGDTIEAGDVLSDGIPNPAEIVKHKGIGEGRRYFTKAFKDIYKASGIKAHRRNVELISRGLINHVRLTDELGDYVPDDIVPYDVLEHAYKPRPGHEVTDIRRAVGKYLEKPVLHYSIGTKIRPSMLSELKHFKVNTVVVHDDPPPFEPEMIRGMESLQHDPDWMTRHLGSNLKKSLLTAVHRGASSNELGTSFVPPLARAVDFGRIGLTKGWNPQDLGEQ